MEVLISLTPQQYASSQQSNFIIKFFWYEKNRTFEIPKSCFTHNYSSKYQYHFKLPSIVKGKYRFHASGSISEYTLKLTYSGYTLYNSSTQHKNHTFKILENIQNGNKTYSIHHFPLDMFLKEEKAQRTQITKRSMKRWNYYWYNLHYFSLNYYPNNPTPQNKQQVCDLVKVMSTTGIPCPRCKAHFNQYIHNHPIENSYGSAMDLFKYFVELHNDVNKRNGKQIFSLENAITKYNKSIEYENELHTMCKPLYQCFIDGDTDKFPAYLHI